MREKGGGEDFLVHLLHILVVEGREPANHFIEQGTERPPVDALAVAFIFQDFRGEVLREGGREEEREEERGLTVVREACNT